VPVKHYEGDKTKVVRSAGHVARVEKGEVNCNFVAIFESKKMLGRCSVDGGMILECSLKYIAKQWIGFIQDLVNKA
jgi:hypothetical protein